MATMLRLLAAFFFFTVEVQAQEPNTIEILTRAGVLVHYRADGSLKAYRVGVGRPGFAWTGTERVTRKAEWPDWYPPDDMRKRDRTLPKRVPGGPNNPMGARAIYLGTTLYRIHGSNEVETIGQSISSGCFRMRNEDVIELYKAVTIGMKVTVRR